METPFGIAYMLRGVLSGVPSGVPSGVSSSVPSSVLSGVPSGVLIVEMDAFVLCVYEVLWEARKKDVWFI